jgi:4-amino-4-deoxy-L-arabinose transferase-like glycosyltransferase
MAMSARAAAIALALITALGAALRWWGIEAEALWADEALTAVIAEAPAPTLLTEPLDPSGPLYYWLHQLFVPGDPSAAAMRSVSFAAGVLTVPATYAVGHRFLERPAALLASAMVALSFPLVDHAKEARGYALLALLFCAVAGFLLAAGTEERRGRRWTLLAGFGVVALAALHTHPTAFPFVAIAIALAVLERSRIARREAIAVGAAVALLALPESWRIWRYSSEANAFGWLAPFGPLKFAATVGGEWLPFAKAGGAAIAAAGLGLLVAAGTVGRAPFMALRREQPLAFWLLAAWLAHPLVLWLLGMLTSPVLMVRTMLPAWPAFALAVALGLSGLRGRTWGVAVAGILAAYAAWLWVAGPAREKEDWRGAAERVQAWPADAVLVCPSWKAPALLAALDSRERTVLVNPGGRWRKVGKTGAWPRSHARGLWFAQVKRWLGPPPPMVTEQVRARRVLLVESECASPDWPPALPSGRTLVSWSSGARQHDPALGEAAEVRVELRLLERPLELDVMVPAP